VRRAVSVHTLVSVCFAENMPKNIKPRPDLFNGLRWFLAPDVGGGPTPDKPNVTLSVPDPHHINSFLNFRVADIQACYELWKGREAEFITAPIPKYGEIRCYIRDPDGYIIEVGQSTDLEYG
jgi:catechol 2,3-dioxygenase-like lactoylglutathione lyase family enzyme